MTSHGSHTKSLEGATFLCRAILQAQRSLLGPQGQASSLWVTVPPPSRELGSHLCKARGTPQCTPTRFVPLGVSHWAKRYSPVLPELTPPAQPSWVMSDDHATLANMYPARIATCLTLLAHLRDERLPSGGPTVLPGCGADRALLNDTTKSPLGITPELNPTHARTTPHCSDLSREMGHRGSSTPVTIINQILSELSYKSVKTPMTSSQGNNTTKVLFKLITRIPKCCLNEPSFCLELTKRKNYLLVQ